MTFASFDRYRLIATAEVSKTNSAQQGHCEHQASRMRGGGAAKVSKFRSVYSRPAN